MSSVAACALQQAVELQHGKVQDDATNSYILFSATRPCSPSTFLSLLLCIISDDLGPYFNRGIETNLHLDLLSYLKPLHMLFTFICQAPEFPFTF